MLTSETGLEECLQSRPPLRLDLTGPKPTTYDPPMSLPWETSSPSYTMRPKTQPEKGTVVFHIFVCNTYFHIFSKSLSVVETKMFLLINAPVNILLKELTPWAEFKGFMSLEFCLRCFVKTTLKL